MSFLDYLCDITSATPIGGHRLRVTCSDGASGVFDMTPYLDQPAFRPLLDPDTFSRVRIVAGAPTWPDGIDIAPERIRSDMTADR